FEFEKGKYELVGKVEEDKLNRKEIQDPVFNMKVVKYLHKAIFRQSIKVKDPTKPIKGYLNFMTCNNERCLPPKDVDFSFVLQTPGKTNSKTKVISEHPGKTETHETTPIANIDTTQNKIDTVAAAIASAGICANINSTGGLLDQRISSIIETYKNPLGNCGNEDTTRNLSLIWTFLFGFLGGLIALLTPCVFPMIPLTVSFFTKGSKDRKSGTRNGILYGLSIIIIYVTIGLLITAVFGATALNALSTNWIANSLFFLIFIFFAISFFGYYEITLPSWLANKSDAMADKGGLVGIFFMAFTLAIVSFSCTGPIIGSAIVESAKSSIGPFVVMLGFSIALALPFGLFAAFPAWLNTLPKSGSWMNSVKVVLGFLELALAFKFLSVADMTSHWGILKYEVFMGIWVIVFALMTIYLFGKMRFPHDSPLKKLTLTRKIFALLSLVWTVYLISGFFYNDVTKSYDSKLLLSGLAPPAHYNYFIKEETLDPAIKSKYPSYSKAANNLNCFKDYCEGLAYAKEIGKPILIDFTGYGCVNCRKTEEHIWVSDKVRNKIINDYVLISLYVDDKKKLDEIKKSTSRNDRIKTIGDIWADLQIVNFQQNSQPLYVLMTPDEKVLAKPRGYKEGVKEYDQFLQCGLDAYNLYKSEKTSKLN
ncbi:MAG TPA: cytochrome c biogenesis protein CcdA, partial [Saprospiraceae bacterium]|nr:cytochrome c biogenesis protein CcdA [Saprospiraceae bacterium]